MIPVQPVLLSGGSGTRLWPLSREAYPKQFLPLVGEETMLQATWQRVAPLAPDVAPIVVANESHRFLVERSLRGPTPFGSHLPHLGDARRVHEEGDLRSVRRHAGGMGAADIQISMDRCASVFCHGVLRAFCGNE